MKHWTIRGSARRAIALSFAFVTLPCVAIAQDRLKTMPGYEQYARVAPQIPGSVKLGVLQTFWVDSGKAFEYQRDGKWYRYDVATRKAAEISTPTSPDSLRRGGRFGGRGGPERGRQFASADSPDGKRKAFYRDRNLWVSNADGSEAVGHHDRRQREGSHQVRHRQLGLRRGAAPDDRHVVVARRHEARLLSLRREQGPRLLPRSSIRRRSQSTIDTEAYPQGRRAESDRRSVRLRRRFEAVGEVRRP